MSRTLAVNCSIMLKDLPVEDRLTVVADAGFEAVEFWWPFASATPADVEVDRFAAQIEESGLELVGLNLFAGDMAAGDRGVVSWPGRTDELLASAEIAAALARRLGTRNFNALYGNRVEDEDPRAQDALAVENLRLVAAVLATVDGTVLLEPVSAAARYPLRTAADVVGVIDAVAADGGPQNLGLLLDVYHLAVNGDDVDAAITRHSDRVAHVQVADAPGRGVPGSGDLPLLPWMRRLRESGYDGRIALEYTHDGVEPFDDLDRTAWKEIA